MKTKVVFVIQGILASLFGLSFVIFPEFAMAPFLGDRTVSASFFFLSRVYGAVIIGVAILCWAGLRITDVYAKRVIAAAIGTWALINGILFIFGTLGGAITSLGWSQVVLGFVLAALFGATFLTKQP
jgi:hypothetical protein